MDFFQQQLNKNREAFISIREAITGLQESSPKSSVSTIAQALLQLEELNYFQLTARLSKDMSNEIHDWAPCDKLLSEIAYFGDIREIDFGSPEQWDYEAFPDGKLDPDYIGWHRKGFIDQLLVRGWPIPDSMYRFNGTQKNNIPDWFKPYLSRPYLGIDEAGWIIAKNNFTGDAGDFKWATKEFKFMLRESVKEGLINLSINGGSIIDDENYWRLDVQDIRRLCHNSELAWPIPWQEEPDQPLSTESAKLQEQVKRLQEQVKQFESQAKELETLKQENAELKAKIEALSDGQNPDTPSQDIDPRLKNTLYKMIYAMAKDCYKYDPRAPRNDATNDIYLAIADAKLSLGKDAIREHLKESAKLAS